MPDNSRSPTGDDALMAAELEHLASPLGLLRNFPGELEVRFRRWLDLRMQALLRQYLWALLVLYGFLMAVTAGSIAAFSDEPQRSSDLHGFLIQALALGGAMLLLMLAVRQPVAGGRFRYAVAVVSIALLVILGVGVQAYGDDYNRLMGMVNLWVAATVIFATGLHLPRSCIVIMLFALPGIVLGPVALGLADNLWRYTIQLLACGIFLLVFSFVMARVQRQVFLQEGILLHDKTRLLELSGQLAELSLQDALTGVANRRRFDEVLEREWGRARRQRSPLALLFIDVDHFKAYNDHYGHQAGDDGLRAIALALVESGRRESDLVARYGGEEFVLLLPDTDEAGALGAARRIQTFLAQAALPHETAPLGRVTASIGVAVCVPSVESVPAGLVAAADKAVYRAKKNGRDCIVLASRDEEAMAAES